MTAAPRNELETDVQVRADGFVRVVLRGRLDAQTVPACRGNLERSLREAKIKTLQVDASGLRFCDGAGRALLRYVNMGRTTPKATVSLLELEPDLEKVLLGFTSEDYEAFRPKPPIETHTSGLDVLIVYDTLRSGKHAKELCDRLGEQLLPAFKMNLSIWSLSALQLLPTMAQAAAREAEHAALLIVAVNGGKTVPRTAKNCLDCCARGLRAAGGALIAQLHGILKTNEELCPPYGCLRAIARHVGLRFFSQVVELPDNELNAPLETVHDRAQPNAPAAARAQSMKISNNSTHAAP